MFDINKSTLSGEILQLETFKTRKGTFALNLRLKTVNRYVDILPLVAYGILAETINKELRVGDGIIVNGRIMEIPSVESKVPILRVVIEKIAKELTVPMLPNNKQVEAKDI
jgi:single-stranded DNA-binding protein